MVNQPKGRDASREHQALSPVDPSSHSVEPKRARIKTEVIVVSGRAVQVHDVVQYPVQGYPGTGPGTSPCLPDFGPGPSRFIKVVRDGSGSTFIGHTYLPPTRTQ